MGYLNGANIKDTNGPEFKIWRDSNNTFYFLKGGETINDETYLQQVNKGLLDVIDKTVLVAGLGLGIVPQWLAKRRNKVYVVEKDQHLIQAIRFYDYLDKNITIIKDDIYSFIPKIKYDIAFIDVWNKKEDRTEYQEGILSRVFEGTTIVYPS